MSLLASAASPPAPPWALHLLQASLLVLVLVGATAVVLTRQPVRQVVTLSIYGLVLALLFFSYQAPDVSLSELTIGAVVLPLLLLLALAKLKSSGR
ncbi:MAG TPA: hydrogenase subunit MbhD domain-containing protein [Acidimicrobiales bacterium]|nr:hydrogenase subunit MbhD domain-containing protein [Acidimicrobiales bacterium]